MVFEKWRRAGVAYTGVGDQNGIPGGLTLLRTFNLKFKIKS
jgi:hypothetical protein